MRLVTWNCCRGPYLKKVQLLDILAPDIAVIQECARPVTQTDRCLWFGDNPRQGLAVQAYSQYRLRALPLIADVPNYVIPVEVIGPNHFLLIAVWSKRDPRGHYVEGVVRAVQRIAVFSHSTQRCWLATSTPMQFGIHRTGLIAAIAP